MIRFIQEPGHPVTYRREVPKEPDEFPVLARVKHYIEMPPYKSILYHPDTWVDTRFGGIPSVMQTINIASEIPVTMTRALQEWTYKLVQNNAPVGFTPEAIYKAWYHLYTSDVAFANKTGVDNEEYANFIIDPRSTLPGWKLQKNISHGSTILVTRTFIKYGELHAAFEVADPDDIDTLNISPSYKWWCIMPAVNWSRGGWYDDDRHFTPDPRFPQGYAEPFPKLGNRERYGCRYSAGIEKHTYRLDGLSSYLRA